MTRFERHLWLGVVLILASLLYVALLSDATDATPIAVAYTAGVVFGFMLGRKI